MSWRKSLRYLDKHSNGNSLLSSLVRKRENGMLVIEKNHSITLQSERGYTTATRFHETYLGRIMAQRDNVPSSSVVKLLVPQRYAMVISRRYNQSVENDPDLNRDFFVRLWVEDRKKFSGKRKRKVYDNAENGRLFSGTSVPDERPYDKMKPVMTQPPTSQSVTSVPDERPHDEMKPVMKQPPTSQSVTGLLKPCSPEEAQIAPLLARSNLLITRDIEWGNLVLGFEQESQYAMIDACHPETPVGYIREQSNVIARQVLRLRRPFVASITDGSGTELFRVRRPFWWITSSIYAEINGKEIGVVHRRWHLWRRIYDLYLGNKQFAVVENPGLWNWTFTLKGINGEVLAEIDRNWRGFGFEIMTDAGQYVIRFGEADSSDGLVKKIEELEVARPLTLSERAIAVALAVSLDNDYFSRHGGWGIPFIAVGE